MKTLNPDLFRKNLLVYTARAFALLPAIDKARILDLGCGTGGATLELAQLCNGSVGGLDRDEKALEILERKIAERGLSDRVRTVHCRIEDMSFGGQRFDIIWAEGALGGIGFTPALKLLRVHLEDGGFLVVHDEAAGYRGKLGSVTAAGYSLHGFFQLPEDVWWNEYFRHLEIALPGADAAEAPYDLAVLRQDLEKYKSEPHRFRSAFFLMQKA